MILGAFCAFHFPELTSFLVSMIGSSLGIRARLEFSRAEQDFHSGANTAVTFKYLAYRLNILTCHLEILGWHPAKCSLLSEYDKLFSAK
jgi:hypothetical protein